MSKNRKGVGKNAPILTCAGDKWNKKGTLSDKNPKGLQFSQIPDILMRYMNHHLTGQNGNLLKIMILLMGTKDQLDNSKNWGVSQTWVLDQTGMEKAKYYKAHQELVDMGWLIYEDKGKFQRIGINYTFMWAQASLPDEEQLKVENYRKTRGER